ncbi:MAG TPA: outer membrane beta-barrel protein [Vicinamibacteria bacterium]|nr:outer membrane beta-barrel protein [Vicinamibacteria bacterium]
MSRATAAVLALGLVAASPAAGWASGLELRVGGFFPRAQSDLFDDDNQLYTPDSRSNECTATSCPGVMKKDWIGVYGGAEYSFNVAPHLELGISLDGYSREIPTSYRDSVREDGSEISQTLKLTVIPLGVSLRALPADRYAPVQPYLTLGADVFFYKYEEFGDFIDFFSNNLDISSDSFKSDGAALGGHAAAGLRIPLGHDFAITAEGRYQFAQKKRMGDDFNQNTLDLNGASATIGVRLRF